MQHIIGTVIGKSIRHATRLRRGGGQALPGLVIERLFPSYFARMLRQLPEGVVVVTGTNGKTSVAEFTRQILKLLNKKSASIGITQNQHLPPVKTGDLM